MPQTPDAQVAEPLVGTAHTVQDMPQCAVLDEVLRQIPPQALRPLLQVPPVLFEFLVGGLAPTALAAHAIGHHAQRTAGHPGMGQQRDLVLLVGAIAAMQAGGCSDPKRLCWCIHRREYKLAPHGAKPANR